MLLSRSNRAQAKPRRRNSKPLAAHPLFVPTLVLWGAALAGLSVFVLPASVIAQLVPSHVLSMLGNHAWIVLPLIAAIIGASALYLIASVISRAATGSRSAADDEPAQTVRAIDPGAELGSDSLDAPLDEFDFIDTDTPVDDADNADFADFDDFDSGDPDWVENLGAAAASPAGHSPEPPPRWDVPPVVDMPAEASDPEWPEDDADWQDEELDLAAFAEAEPTPPPPAPSGIRAKPQSAVEKLRAVPPQELSLVEMVERLALALQEHKASGHGKAAPDAGARRDAALADALKALSQFTPDGFESHSAPASPALAQAQADRSEAEMREALAKLQRLRGAA